MTAAPTLAGMIVSATVLIVLLMAVTTLLGWVMVLRKKVEHRDELIADLKDAIDAQEPANDWRRNVL